MLMPKKTKFRKMRKGRMGGLSKGAKELEFGTFGLRALEPVWFSAQQIEAIRMTISREIKKEGKLFIRVFPDKPITKKPAETRMGKGKGNPEYWVAVVKRNRIIFELSEVDEERAKAIFKTAAYKLPMKTQFVKKVE